MSELKPGLTGTASLTVADQHTANSVGSGTAGVLATPVMINLIEAAALNAIEAHLPETSQSLGIYLEVSHVAATPVGMKAYATAELVKVDGRHLEFIVNARDEIEEIGAGSHHRIVVNVEKFGNRVTGKLKT